MKKVPLKHTNHFTLVDEEDYKSLTSPPYKSWLYYQNKAGNEYARARIKLPGGSWALVLMHRVITGAGPGEEINHIDRDGLNNRRQNLRFSNRSQNNGSLNYEKILVRNPLKRPPDFAYFKEEKTGRGFEPLRKVLYLPSLVWQTRPFGQAPAPRLTPGKGLSRVIPFANPLQLCSCDCC